MPCFGLGDGIIGDVFSGIMRRDFNMMNLNKGPGASVSSKFLGGAILVAMLVCGGCQSAPQASADDLAASEAASNEAAPRESSDAEQTPKRSEEALDTLLRLAGGGERELATDYFVYVAGSMIVMEADVEADMAAYYRAQESAAFAPPIWGWAVAHKEDARVEKVLEAAEARGLPARAIYAEFLTSGAPGTMDPARLPEPTRPLAAELEAPSRAEKLRATAVLAEGPEYLTDMATLLIGHLLGASDPAAIAGDDTITVKDLSALQQEFQAAGLAEQKSLEALFEYVERDQICASWELWREYPDSAPKPVHERGCEGR
ncbi:hypothetical protein DFR33_105240 [Bradymonas sediminis]|nr:hypothetical protein DFR33_105240 [Bradymonas sediminis]